MKRLITCYPCEGGICHYSYCLGEALQNLGDDTTVLMYNYGRYELKDLKHQHIAKLSLRSSFTRWGRAVNPLLNIATLLRESQDIPLVHYQYPAGPRTDLMQWRALKARGRRIVYTAHDVVPHYQSGTRQEMHTEQLYQEADAVIVHGNKLKQDLLELSGIPEDKIHIVPHGNYNFIADRFQKWTRESARESLGYGPHETVVLFFGFIKAYKGLDDLIAACKLIVGKKSASNEHLRLLIAGSSTKEFWTSSGYEKQVSDAGLSDRTQMVTEYIALEDVARFFLAADIIVLPYKNGSQSGILQLAYSFSKPVIVTKVGSIFEIVQNGVTGLITEPNDPEAFAAALDSLVSNPAFAQLLGKQGRAYAETALSWDQIAKTTQNIYKSLT